MVSERVRGAQRLTGDVGVSRKTLNRDFPVRQVKCSMLQALRAVCCSMWFERRFDTGLFRTKGCFCALPVHLVCAGRWAPGGHCPTYQLLHVAVMDRMSES